MNKPPAFQFYADDFIAGTITLTHAERGLYILALCLQWNQGGVSTDDLSHLAGSTPTARVLQKFEQGEDGLFRNKRLEAERKKQSDYRQAQSNNGKASAKARFNGGSTVVQPATQPDTQPNTNSPSPSPSPIINTHTSECPDAGIPTKAEVLTEADMRGVTRDSALSFFDHHDNNQLWVNQFGRLINWRAKLLTWASKDKTMPKPNAAPQKPAQSVFNLKTIIEAKTEQANALKARWAVETGLDTTWSSQEAKADYNKMRSEIKQLKQQLAAMA
jgi:uncharacterized protein YdaU (DUF1376 family)